MVWLILVGLLQYAIFHEGQSTPPPLVENFQLFKDFFNRFLWNEFGMIKLLEMFQYIA